jgi:beta-mannosidase
MTGPVAWTGTARWTLHTLAGERLDAAESAVTLAANASTELTPPPSWSRDLDRPLIATLALDAADAAAPSARNSAWPEPLRWHRLPDPQLTVTVEPDGALRLDVARPAKGVWIEAPGLRLADNFVDLLPGSPLRLAVLGGAVTDSADLRVAHLHTLQGPQG